MTRFIMENRFFRVSENLILPILEAKLKICYKKFKIGSTSIFCHNIYPCAQFINNRH